MAKASLLVTGGAGFMGSEFVRQAVNKNYKISVLDSFTYAGDLRRLRDICEKVQIFKSDICRKDQVGKVFARIRPDFVVHFAAETHVDRSILWADRAIQTNILGTQNLLDAALKFKVGRFVHISTDEVYGEIAKGRFNERSPFAPSSPYSAAKASADLLVSACARTFGLPAVIVRPCNNYGPWQYPEKFLPVIIYKALTNKKIPVYGKGENIREWLFVSDGAEAILKVMQKGKLGEAYNIGSGTEKKNLDVVRAVLKELGRRERLIEFVKDRPGHDFRYSIDSDKIRRELGWKPEMDFGEGIGETIEFYKKNFSWLEKKVSGLKSYWSKVYKKV